MTMSLTYPKRLADCAGPRQALEELCAPFAGFPGDHVADGTAEVQPDDMPEPYRWLLVHDAHMTKVLEARYDRPVELHVVENHLEEDRHRYARRIFLTLPGTSHELEYGVVRLDLNQMPEDVKAEILARQKPLGAILIGHDVHREVQPHWYLRFDAGCPMLRWFGNRAGTTDGGPMYGRIGTIYCDGEPAIELLEIATGAERRR